MDPGSRYENGFPSADNAFVDDDLDYSDNDNNQPLSLMAPEPLGDAVEGLGVRGKNYMVLRSSSPQEALVENGDDKKTYGTISFTSLLNSIGGTDTLLQKGSAYLLKFLSCSHRMFCFFIGVFCLFYLYPGLCILLIGGMTVILLGGHQNEDNMVNTRTAKWTVTGFSYQMKDGFLASPPFLDKCGQWRAVIKQKRGMDGLQTSFGLMCTDIFPEIEQVTATVTFFCTNQLGQEVATGGMRTLTFQHEYQCPGDCGFSRHVRLPRKVLGRSEVITVHCTVEFKKTMVTFFRTLARSLGSMGADGFVDGDGGRRSNRKGKNVVAEQGEIFPGNFEYHEEESVPSQFRPVMRFINHAETRTFIWEIPNFCGLLENSELWGVYSPQFFVNSRDFCAIWRMKLLEVQGVFRLHVQLRGLPRSVKQIKLWYLIQLVDMYGDSVVPEHAVCRVKYPDHMNLWDTTRHILYRRETILERFIGGSNNGALTLRISLQMEPNDLALMEVDSDEWIHCPAGLPGCEAGAAAAVEPKGLRRDAMISISKTNMLTN